MSGLADTPDGFDTYPLSMGDPFTAPRTTAVEPAGQAGRFGSGIASGPAMPLTKTPRRGTGPVALLATAAIPAAAIGAMLALAASASQWRLAVILRAYPPWIAALASAMAASWLILGLVNLVVGRTPRGARGVVWLSGAVIVATASAAAVQICATSNGPYPLWLGLVVSSGVGADAYRRLASNSRSRTLPGWAAAILTIVAVIGAMVGTVYAAPAVIGRFVAQQDYFAVGSDQVPSLRLALGETRPVVDVGYGIRADGWHSLDAYYRAASVSSGDVTTYGEFLEAQGFVLEYRSPEAPDGGLYCRESVEVGFCVRVGADFLSTPDDRFRLSVYRYAGTCS